MNDLTHIPVLLNEAMEALAIKEDGIYIDGTFGRGGHAKAILEKLGALGKLLAFDKDVEAIRHGQGIQDKRLSLYHKSYTQIYAQVDALGLMGKIDGLLLDCGVSSPQLDDPERGLSFMRDGPLDMRMDKQDGMPVRDWLMQATEKELADVFYQYGEESRSRAIAKAVVNARQQKPIERTLELADICRQVKGQRHGQKHPATKVFQALRIFINQELQALDETLSQIDKILAPKGRIVVISFHSLEDALVKKWFRFYHKGDQFPKGVPISSDQLQPTLHLVKSHQAIWYGN